MIFLSQLIIAFDVVGYFTEGFKKIVENFKEYNSVYKRTHSADKRHAS